MGLKLPRIHRLLDHFDFHGVEEGRPLEGISTGLIYDLPGVVLQEKTSIVITHPLEKPATQFHYELSEPANVHMWVTDAAGDLVVTLVDEEFETGDFTVMWNAVDDDGVPVPSGLYYAHLQIDEKDHQISDLFLLYLDPADFLNAPNATTDANGRFRIPMNLIPVGMPLHALDENGDLIEQTNVGVIRCGFWRSAQGIQTRSGSRPPWTSVPVHRGPPPC